MMKKKLFSLAVTLVMALSLAVPAMAVDVTISNGNTNATYDAYQIMTLVQSGDNYAYTVNDEWVSVLTDYLEIETGGKTDAAINNAILEEISRLDPAGTRDLADHLFTQIAGKTKVTHSDGATFTVDPGYYLIVETTETPAAGEIKSLVIMDTANNEEIQINSKRDTVPVKKTTSVDEDKDGTASVDVGDKIPFTITSKIPANVAEYEDYTFVITDTMTAGLSYNNNAVVTVNGETVEGVVTVAGQTITINLSSYITTNKDTLGGADVTITYTATLTAEAVTVDEINNKVTIEYSNDPYENSTGKTPTPEVDFDLYDINIAKTDGTNPLADAKFQLTNDENEYAIATSDGDGTYDITGWTTTATEATTFVSPESGNINIDGLAVGDYTLTETAAPEGYNLLDDPITVRIDKDGNVTTSITEGPVTVITVVNESGVELPSTGGMGTTIFYVVGGTLVVAAAVLLITKKRMHNVED